MNTRENLYTYLKEHSEVFKSATIEAAFRAIDRADFVPEDYMVEAYEDYPLPIGHEQTISQPTTVAFMLEQLHVEEGDTVLDLGSGSGWTTALLAHMVGEEGRVYGVELIPELVTFGRKNLAKYEFPHASITQAGKELGLPKYAPFDRILASAEAEGEEIAEQLLNQLKVGGTMVAPVDGAIVVYEKRAEAPSDDPEKPFLEIERKEFPGFMFVPLIVEDRE